MNAIGEGGKIAVATIADWAHFSGCGAGARIEDSSYCPARLLEPRYCRVTDSVAPRNINQGFACCSSRQRFLLLMRSKLRLASKLHSALLRTLSALACARYYQVPFELR